MPSIKRVAPVLVLILLAFSFLVLFSFSENIADKTSGKSIIVAATNFGTETIVHEKFINELKQGARLNQNSTVRIFLGSYAYLFGIDGILIPDPPDYYIFIDTPTYLSLNKEETRALIAHEFGHAVYEISFVDKLQLRIFSKFNIFNNRRREILTKYQIKADLFSAEKTSPEAMISVLNKITTRNGGTKSWEYESRIQNLEKINRLRQGSH